MIYNIIISIHALRDESDTISFLFLLGCQISIHALREESDIWVCQACLNRKDFNPRSPWGERLLKVVCTVCPISISIHALREESDISLPVLSPWARGISIHALREESDYLLWIMMMLVLSISIHALREESDNIFLRVFDISWIFQSTLSVRRATRLTMTLTVA